MRERPVLAICFLWILWILSCHLFSFPFFGEVERKAAACLPEEGVTGYALGVVEEVQITERSVRCVVRGNTLLSGTPRPVFSRIQVQMERTEEREEILPGFVLSADGLVQALEHATNPGQFDAASYYGALGIHARMRAEEVTIRARRRTVSGALFLLRGHMQDFLGRHMHEAPAGILSAMILGDKRMLTEESRRNFQVGGCLHMLVISGLHVSLLGGAIRKLLLRLPLPPSAATCAAGALMLFYTALIDWPVAAVRACLMFLLQQLALLARRTYDPVSALAASAVLILLRSPGMLFHAGFQLSFAASFGAIVGSPRLQKKSVLVVPGTKKRILAVWWEKTKESSLSWAAIQLSTLPLLAYYFYELPVFALPLNLLLLPLLPFVLGAGMTAVLAGLLLPPVGHFLLLPVDILLQGMDIVLSLARRLPGSTWICGQPRPGQVIACYAGMMLALFLLVKKKEDRSVSPRERERARRLRVFRKGIAPISLVVLLARPFPGFSLTMLDVGQGDCFVIREGGNVVLSDGGSSSIRRAGAYRILPYLYHQRISEISLWTVSHDDLDHVSGVEEILEEIIERKTALRIRCIAMPLWMRQTETGERLCRMAAQAGTDVVFPEAGDTICLGKMRLSILHPFPPPDPSEKKKRIPGSLEKASYPDSDVQSGNAGSLVFLLDYGKFRALFTGDLEGEGEEELLPYLETVDCLKVAHHGSAHSTSEAFLEKTAPRLALVSAPKKSIYRHPHPETLDRLEGAGAMVLETRSSGAVRLEIKKGTLRIRAFRETESVEDRVEK